VVEKIESAAKNIKKPIIACLGISFKPNIDDLRESPALEITKKLASNNNYQILAVEPNIEELPKNINNITLSSLQKALDSAHIIAILVKHNEFIDFRKSDFNNKKILDFVNI